MDLTAALRWLNSAAIASTGNKLREPELVILKGTWRGLTYEQMADGSEYSTNYLMRDVAPKLWKQLSNVFGRSVGKTNFRVALEAHAAANASVGSELFGADSSSSDLFSETMGDPASGLAMSARSAIPMGDRMDGRYWPNRTADRLSGPAFEESSVERASTPVRYDYAALRSRLKVPMYGYERELARLRRWIVPTEPGEVAARAVGIWGLTGIGKTMLAERLLAEVGGSFDRVVVRSLQEKPLLSELCISILSELGMSGTRSQALSALLAVMAQQSVLLLLEDLDSILEPGQLAGGYTAGYEGYADLLAGASGLRGCILVTGIEGSAELVRQGDFSEESRGQRMRSLFLQGIDSVAVGELLSQEGLSARSDSMESWGQLTERYQGHPLALKAAARVIREIFDGRVDEFLSQMSVLFTDVLRLLSPSFLRLSAAELNILYWLASQDKPLSLAELRSTLPISLRPSELISALDSLKQRSLLAINLHSQGASSVAALDGSIKGVATVQAREIASPTSPATFHLPVMVKAYAIHQFVGQFGKQNETLSQTTGYGATSDRLLEPAIALGSSSRTPVRLSRWFEGQFDACWQPLDSLFAAVARPALRLRSTYHFRDETFVKRCKSVVLSASDKTVSAKQAPGAALADALAETSAILLIAIHKEGEDLYKICVQAQPSTEETVLPEALELKLLDAQETVLASVRAQQADSFIQLPYFQGVVDEPFEIALALEFSEYRERFVI